MSEAITLYLAAAAPFGVAFFLRRHVSPRVRPRALALAALAGLAWPATTLLMLSRKSTGGGESRSSEEAETSEERTVERGVRAVASALSDVGELCGATSVEKDERLSYVLFAARRAVERFAGLALVAKGASVSAAAAPRELELCRAAGRTGEDLRLAGRCTHRRNVLRLLLHRERARNEMLHALAEVSETARRLAHEAHAPRRPTPRELSDAILRAYDLALEVLTGLDDERAVAGVRRLIDAERAHLRGPAGESSDSRRSAALLEEDYVRHERQLQRL
ncbi:MAG TPA: hypothetical protein VF240_12785 [Pyrinomonadaceae bacterium]